jgi:hypothetical protein
MPIDPALIGFWVNGPDQIRLKDDGWQYSVQAVAYTVSADYMNLNIGTSSYTRLYGVGETVLGVWVGNPPIFNGT